MEVSRKSEVSRRNFLKATAGLAGLAGTGVLLEACGSSSGGGSTTTTSPLASTTTTTLKAKTGGSLSVGITGGSSSDVVDGMNPYTTIDVARTGALFEPLVQYEANGKVTYRLAEEFTPNGDGTAWTIRVRQGLTWHDGKPITAEDVIFTLQYMMNPKAPTLGSAAMASVDPHGLKKLDARTVRVNMTIPQFTLVDQLSAPFFPLIPVGYDQKKPIGSGAFKLDSFVPGQRSTMSRFADYYLSPLPYLDQLVIEDFPDSTSQINALIGGQIDAAASLPWVAVRELSGNSSLTVLNEKSSQWLEYPMRCDTGPFKDVRVRQAFKLLLDRPQFITNVYNGDAILGNDIFSRFDADYNSSLPQRVQDIPKAKSLLKAAGMADYAFSLISGPWTPGLLEGAELLAQQANAAGVKVTVSNQPIGQFVAQSYLKAPFASGYWYGYGYAAQCVLSMTLTAGQNETHWNDAEWTGLWNKLNRTADPSAQRDVVHQMQAIEYDRGGILIPAFYNEVDALKKNVEGLAANPTLGPLNNFHFEEAWIS